MKIEHSLINIDSLANYKNNKSNFFTPISLNQGSETIAFYSLVSAGKIQEESTLADFDTFSILLKGSGLFGFGNKLVTAKSGNCRLIPKNRESFFINTIKKVFENTFLLTLLNFDGKVTYICLCVTRNDIK